MNFQQRNFKTVMDSKWDILKALRRLIEQQQQLNETLKLELVSIHQDDNMTIDITLLQIGTQLNI